MRSADWATSNSRKWSPRSSRRFDFRSLPRIDLGQTPGFDVFDMRLVEGFEMRSLDKVAAACLAVVCSFGLAFQPRQDRLKLDGKTIPPAISTPAVRAVAIETLPAHDTLRQGWQAFAHEHLGWQVWIDERSGLPTLASGAGVPWFDAQRIPSLEQAETRARQFLSAQQALLGRWDSQLVLRREGSGLAGDRVYHVSFGQQVEGVPVEGARFEFQLVQGQLVAFGVSNWSVVQASTHPRLTQGRAQAALESYLGVVGGRDVEFDDAGSLRLVVVDPRNTPTVEWKGSRGRGLSHRLVWRFALRVPDEPAVWIADVDAQTGAIVAFHDDTRYEQVMGAVYPISNDGNCPTGCAQAGMPMPFADYTIDNGGELATDDFGNLDCSAGTIRSRLAGPYIRVVDNCGAVLQSGPCASGVDFGTNSGTDCAVPPGASAGNTHAARSSFYHLNRAMQIGRAWLPDNSWLQSRVTDNVNINNTCNAFWNGSVNFYRSGGGCRNTGEIQGVFVHEWGHGLDQNDGGGYDNSSEAYADIVAIFYARESCVGRGFFVGQTCGGYGDTCLTCTGIRELDWAQRAANEPATPQGFLTQRCGGGGGPCGREVHCESYPAAEALFDLATRDLPASGMSLDSGWQTAEKLWYLSRKNSGGNAYNCALPSSDGCGTNSWFHKLRLVDDDDGNLNNGTPNAQAIFQAFARHGIACGSASDPSNQSFSACGGLNRPEIVQATNSGGSVRLAWTTVPGASKYRVFRSELGCDRGQVPVASVAAPNTSFIDDGVPAGTTAYYRIQAYGSTEGCQSEVSSCESQRRPLQAVVTERSKGWLTGIALLTGQFGPIVTTGLSLPSGVSLTRDEARAYVAEEGSGELSSVVLADGALTVVANGLSAPRGTPRLNFAETHAYLAESTAGRIARVQLSNGAITRLGSGLSTPVDVVLDSEERYLYVTEQGSGELSRLDLATGATHVVATGLQSPRFVQLDAKDLIAFVTEGNSGALARVDIGSGTVTRPANGLNLPLGLDLSCSENTAYVAESGSGEISAVTLTNGQVTLMVEGLTQPSGLALKLDDTETRAIPRELKGLRFLDAQQLTWDSEAAQAGSRIQYDVLRGDVAEVASYQSNPSDRCVIEDGLATSATITEIPPAGRAYYYLVRGNNGCGAGRYQRGIAGVDRSATACR
jgi:DNA-binding beta-propeller fold protein YncE